MLSKKILIPVLAAGILGVGVVGVSQVHAATNTDPSSSLVDALVKKFNLDKTQVQTVVDEFHNQRKAERQATMKTKVEDRLTQAVKNGKLTEAQKQAILDKLASVKNSFDANAFKNMTPDQKKAAIQKQREELKAWAKSQGIDPVYLMFFGMPHPGGLRLWLSPSPTT